MMQRTLESLGAQARLAGLLLASAIVACSSNDDDQPAPVCELVHGLWSVSVDYGNGLVARQQWQIDQQVCDISLTADPPDLYGASLTSGNGYVAEDGLFAWWSKNSRECVIDSALDATVAGTRFAGTLTWVRRPSGQGYCPVASGRFAVSGER